MFKVKVDECLNCRVPFVAVVAKKIEAEFIAYSGACCPACCKIAYSKK